MKIWLLGSVMVSSRLKHMVKKIDTNKAPKAAGPYSQAIKAGNLVFCSGQIGLSPKTNQLTKGIEKETKQALKNLLEVLKVAKLSFKNVIKVEVFVTDIKNFDKVNKIYGDFFIQNPRPARTTVEVSSLPKGAGVEISCIAYEEK